MTSKGSSDHRSVGLGGQPDEVTLFLCGDVMTGRGVDQILPDPCEPRIYESYVKSAQGYVDLAERANGPIPRPVNFAYVWGEALNELERLHPQVRIINLETSVTRSEAYWPGKGINYRMSPENFGCINVAGIDVCCLANNHVLDWGYDGLRETLETFPRHNLQSTGAGETLEAARAPAMIELPGEGRIIVFAYATRSSGVPSAWAAATGRPGVNLLPDLSTQTVEAIAARLDGVRRENDLVVFSIHWGENWGYAIPSEQRRFAHALIDQARVSVVHGHSSHHVKAAEVYRDRLILYGCGDLINDYEGISGYEQYRDDLGLLYFPTFEAQTGKLRRVELSPTQIRRMRLQLASREDSRWLAQTLARQGRQFGTGTAPSEEGRISLLW